MAFLFKYRFFFFLLVCLPISVIGAEKKPGKKIEEMYDRARAALDRSPDTCLLICDSAITLIDDKQSNQIATFHSIKGFAYEHLGFYRKALQEQFIVLGIVSKNTKDRTKIGNCLNNIGVVYDYMGNLDSALYYYKQGYDLRKQARDPHGISASAGNLGLLYLNKGNFNRALDYLFEAKKIAESVKDSSSLSSVLTNIGLAYDKQGNHTKSLSYYMQSSRIDSLLHDNINLALSYNNIGAVYFAGKDYNKAERYHTNALLIRLRVNNPSGVSESYHNLALVYDAKGQAEKAKAFFEKAMAINEEIHDDYGLVAVMMDLGDYYNRQKKYSKAISYLEKAVALSEKQGTYADANKVYFYLSASYAGTGNYKNAYEYYLKYNAISDSIQSYDNSKKLTELELESDYEKKKQEDAFKIKQRELKLEADKKHARLVQWALTGGISLLLLVIIIVLRGNRNKQKANIKLQEQNNIITNQHKEIEEQKNIIEEKNRDITDSIQYALRLQQAILPVKEMLNKNLGEYFVLYRPKDIVSGDFYWAHETQKGFLLAVVDCTGHGVPGSMVSIIANNALNRAVDEFGLYHPADILNKLTALVEEYFSRHKQGEIRDGMDISLCLVNHDASKLEFAGANNSLWIVRQNNGSAELTEVKADKQPIGHYEHRKPYTNHIIDLHKQDMLYLYTDGYADQFGGGEVNRAGKKFKSTRLKDMLISIAGQPTAQQQKVLEETLEKWSDGFEQNDDICMMGVRV